MAKNKNDKNILYKIIPEINLITYIYTHINIAGASFVCYPAFLYPDVNTPVFALVKRNRQELTGLSRRTGSDDLYARTCVHICVNTCA